jgi:hypothetical protein
MEMKITAAIGITHVGAREITGGLELNELVTHHVTEVINLEVINLVDPLAVWLVAQSIYRFRAFERSL